MTSPCGAPGASVAPSRTVKEPRLGTSSRIARAAGRRRVSRRRADSAACGSISAMSRSSPNCGARAMTSPSWSTTKEWPSKMSSSCPPTSAAERDRAEVVARPLGDHPLAHDALARDVRRRGDVDDDRRPRERLEAHRQARLPDVLADRQPDGDAVDLDERGAGAALEVAHLVEDAVVRQVDLAVVRPHRAVGEDRRGVVDVQAALGEADDRDDPGRVVRRCARPPRARRRGSAP